MPEYKRKIEITAYKLPKNNGDRPTCALEFPDKVCKFLRVTRWGQSQECCYDGTEIKREGDLGYTYVTENCPVWTKGKD